jgi:hypothetical protein
MKRCGPQAGGRSLPVRHASDAPVITRPRRQAAAPNRSPRR